MNIGLEIYGNHKYLNLSGLINYRNVNNAKVEIVIGLDLLQTVF